MSNSNLKIRKVGRPTVIAEHVVTVAVVLPEEHRDSLSELAVARGTTRSALIREALEEYFDL